MQGRQITTLQVFQEFLEDVLLGEELSEGDLVERPRRTDAFFCLHLVL